MCRIAFVCQDLIGQGVQFATATMVRAFVDHGYQVDLIVSKVHSDLVEAGLRPFNVPDSVRWFVMPSRRSSRNWPFLRKYMKCEKADVIVSETRHYVFVLSFASIGLRRIPSLYQVEHLNVPLAPASFIGRVKMRTRHFCAYRKFKGVLVVNDESRRRLQEQTRFLGPRFKVSTVYNAVVDRDFIAKRQMPTTHPWLKDKQCPTIVAAGALHKGKGFDLLLEAMRIVNAKLHVRLVVFGRGNLEGAFKTFIANNGLDDAISIAGFVDNLPAELKAADAFVSSSHAESFSIVLAQALALGIPCISTDVPLGPREVLSNGLYGKLIPDGDVTAMASAIVSTVTTSQPIPPDESWNRFTVDKVFSRYIQAMGLK